MSPLAYLQAAHNVIPSLPAWCPQCHLQPNCKALSMSPPGYLQAAYTVTAMRLLSLPAQHTVISNRKKIYQWEIDTDCSTKPNRILAGANFLEESFVCYSQDFHVVENQSLTLPSHNFVDFFDIPHMQKKNHLLKVLERWKN